MGSSYVTDPLAFIINTLFGLYILVVMLRFLFQAVRADFYNPISQFIVKVTNPPLVPLRRIIPSMGGLDMSAVVLMLALQMLLLFLIVSIQGAAISPWSLFIFSIAELISLLFNVYLFSIIILAIASWIAPGNYNPALNLLHSLTEPVMKHARRMLPPISGIDLSPLLVILAIQVLKMLIIPPLQALA